jgi:hypothetical protein
MTKFIDFTIAINAKKEFKETVFTHVLASNSWKMVTTVTQPSDFENVAYLGQYLAGVPGSQLFKVWDNDPTEFNIYMGTKGDEEYESM